MPHNDKKLFQIEQSAANFIEKVADLQNITPNALTALQKQMQQIAAQTVSLVAADEGENSPIYNILADALTENETKLSSTSHQSIRDTNTSVNDGMVQAAPKPSLVAAIIEELQQDKLLCSQKKD